MAIYSSMTRRARAGEPPYLEEEEFLRIAKALAEPRRVEILELLKSQAEASCQEIGHGFPITQATLSHHLKELTGARLLLPRKAGTFCYYRVNFTIVEMYLRELRRRVSRPSSAAARGRSRPPASTGRS